MPPTLPPCHPHRMRAKDSHSRAAVACCPQHAMLLSASPGEAPRVCAHTSAQPHWPAPTTRGHCSPCLQVLGWRLLLLRRQPAQRAASRRRWGASLKGVVKGVVRITRSCLTAAACLRVCAPCMPTAPVTLLQALMPTRPLLPTLRHLRCPCYPCCRTSFCTSHAMAVPTGRRPSPATGEALGRSGLSGWAGHTRVD